MAETICDECELKQYVIDLEEENENLTEENRLMRIGGGSGIPKMPEEYKGENHKNGGYTNSTPREWTQEELAWCQEMLDRGYKSKAIAESVGRTHASVAIKLKRLQKRDGSYNADHVTDKYRVNEAFLKTVKPSTVLDLFCGTKSFWKGFLGDSVVSNDHNADIDADYHMNALECICMLYPQTFDMVDLDPYGSAYDCFDLAIKMANKALIITFGELGHKRFKRLDFVSRYYGIDNLDDFTLENLIRHVQMIGRRNKKELVPVYTREWRGIGRVWFRIEPIKIIEQWNKSEVETGDEYPVKELDDQLTLFNCEGHL